MVYRCLCRHALHGRHIGMGGCLGEPAGYIEMVCCLLIGVWAPIFLVVIEAGVLHITVFIAHTIMVAVESYVFSTAARSNGIPLTAVTIDRVSKTLCI